MFHLNNLLSTHRLSLEHPYWLGMFFSFFFFSHPKKKLTFNWGGHPNRPYGHVCGSPSAIYLLFIILTFSKNSKKLSMVWLLSSFIFLPPKYLFDKNSTKNPR